MSRRVFLAASGVLATACSTQSRLLAKSKHVFRSQWQLQHNRTWVGPEYWANPLQDWAIENARLITSYPRPDSNLHLLTHQLSKHAGNFSLEVSTGVLGHRFSGSVGFIVGVNGPLGDYQNNILQRTGGIGAGLHANGTLFIEQRAQKCNLPDAGARLVLSGEKDNEAYRLTLRAYSIAENILLAEVRAEGIPEKELRGNVTLATNFTERNSKLNRNLHNFYNPSVYRYESDIKKHDALYGRFWFSDWRVSGDKFTFSAEHSFGPILFSQYTLSLGVMTLSAQMPPLSIHDSQILSLEILKGKRWQKVATASIDADAYTARFRIEGWDDTKPAPYRLVYASNNTEGVLNTAYWQGVIQKDPIEKPRISVADISCNTHQAFPNTAYVRNVKKIQPDLLTFVGDQFYEGSGGYGAETGSYEKTVLDLLRRWYLHGWTWRELTRNTPSVCLPDDHDVLQGNIWGMGGRVGDHKSVIADDVSGYKMPAKWVNMVHRIHTSHHPDAYDATPSIDGISNYYGELIVGGISFAIIADRMYKSGPAEFAHNEDGGRIDHMIDPNFVPRSVDTDGAELLGERQLTFIKDWASNWRGAQMKSVISATIFNAMATHHGPKHEHIVADFDSNGWPQSPRDKALKEIRKAFAFHIAGDQHLPAVVQYGVDDFGDAGFAFAGPAVNVGYPRTFKPKQKGLNPVNSALQYSGDFLDNFGNEMTVVAYKNPLLKLRKANPLVYLHDKASGLGVVHFDKSNQEIEIQCWPFIADASDEAQQLEGWPVVINMQDNYRPKNSLVLPKINISGVNKPVIQVINEATSEIIYTLRVIELSFQPKVFIQAKYTIVVKDTEQGRERRLEGIQPTEDIAKTLSIHF